MPLKKRYNDVMLPNIELIDLADKYKRKRMNGHFSDRLVGEIKNTLESGYQVILFQNRRGYSLLLVVKHAVIPLNVRIVMLV